MRHCPPKEDDHVCMATTVVGDSERYSKIGMIALSFDSKEIAMGDQWLSLEKLSDG
ncbi:hypothetical protein BHE74_00022063 [Ensete ventricosum]|nr:hypothetical protein BHE74_00022063 [Ensete ventricosum]